VSEVWGSGPRIYRGRRWKNNNIIIIKKKTTVKHEYEWCLFTFLSLCCHSTGDNSNNRYTKQFSSTCKLPSNRMLNLRFEHSCWRKWCLRESTDVVRSFADERHIDRCLFLPSDPPPQKPNIYMHLTGTLFFSKFPFSNMHVYFSRVNQFLNSICIDDQLIHLCLY